jgi:ABC-type Fe3+-hydroxamate transport system substrate-binding protein
MDVDENRKEDADELRRHGIELFVTFPKTMNDSVLMIEQMGKTFHAEEAAQRINAEILRQLPKYSASVRQKALVLIWKNPYMTVNHDTYVHDVCSFFGFDNVFASAQDRYPKLSDEQIRQAHPEIVLFPDDPYPFRPRDIAQFLDQFPETPRTLLFDGTLVTWHGYGTLRALQEMPEIIITAKTQRS